MIRAENVWKTYGQGAQSLSVIKGLSLEIPQGQFISIVGRSGSGKTTLLSMLAGLDRPSSGTIEINGQRIDQLDEESLAPLRQKTIGFIFQAFHLVPTLTAYENVTLPAEIAGVSDVDEKAKTLLTKVGLWDRRHHRPFQLSGGEQQRISISRALINDPEILFADEPTGNLDSHHGELVMELLLSLRGRRTLVLVTHDRGLSERADRTLLMVDGVISDDSNNRQSRLA